FAPVAGVVNAGVTDACPRGMSDCCAVIVQSSCCPSAVPAAPAMSTLAEGVAAAVRSQHATVRFLSGLTGDETALSRLPRVSRMPEQSSPPTSRFVDEIVPLLI